MITACGSWWVMWNDVVVVVAVVVVMAFAWSVTTSYGGILCVLLAVFV